jgi:hypothetical protein
MKHISILLLLIMAPVFIAAGVHKFYASVTKIEYVESEKTLQVITQIFTDDLENTLSERYQRKVHLGTKKETPEDVALMKKYILDKLIISVNGKPATLSFIGNKYETDQVKLFYEITGVGILKSMEIENKVLMGMFEDQQNIIHLKTSKNRRSLILERDNPKGLLKFN